MKTNTKSTFADLAVILVIEAVVIAAIVTLFNQQDHHDRQLGQQRPAASVHVTVT